jgi:dTDP-4-amino-4,6-dideoxygalactose transaminase
MPLASRKRLVAQEYNELGYNYRMTDIQAAIGIVQLGRLLASCPDAVSARSVFLPIFGGLSEQDQRRVIDAVLGLVG